MHISASGPTADFGRRCSIESLESCYCGGGDGEYREKRQFLELAPFVTIDSPPRTSGL